MNALSLFESGEVSDITVIFEGETFRLHKFPLILKMKSMHDILIKSSDIEIPHLDGGVELFLDIIRFCYGKELLFTPANIAFLSNAARFLDMSGPDNLIAKTDEYINRLISIMNISDAFGPAVVSLVFAATLKCWEASHVFTTIYEAIGKHWIKRSQLDDRSPAPDLIMVEYLTFLPAHVIFRIIQEFAISGSNDVAIADLVVKFFALRFSLFAINKSMENHDSQIKAIADDVSPRDDILARANPLGAALKQSCIPLERISLKDRKLLEDELSEINYLTIPIHEIMDMILPIVPKEVLLVDRINTEWCKQALAVTESKRDICISRPIILELAGKLLARFTVAELKGFQPQTLKDILATLINPIHHISAYVCKVESDVHDETVEKNFSEVTGSITENLDQYFQFAVENEDMTVGEYVELLKTALPMGRRENNDALIKAICKLIKRNRECLDDNMREEILNVLDLSRCSASGLQEALDNNILPPRAVAEAALRFAKQSINTGNNASLDRLERSDPPPPTRYYSTSSLYRASNYELPAYSNRYVASPYSTSSYYPVTSVNNGYHTRVASPMRQRRRPWERTVYGLGDPSVSLFYPRPHDYTSESTHAKYDNGASNWTEDRLEGSNGNQNQERLSEF